MVLSYSAPIQWKYAIVGKSEANSCASCPAPPRQGPPAVEKDGEAELFLLPHIHERNLSMTTSKQVRAIAIASDFLQRDKQRPIVDPRSELPARMVGDPSGVWARITLDHRIDVAPAYGSRTERRPIPARGWQAVSIYNGGTEVLVVNVRGSRFHIAYYRPGQWERLFRVDWESDDQIHAWGDAPIGDHLDEQHALRAKDLKLEPTRGRPPEVDELRTRVMRPRSIRQPEPRPEGPYSLSVRS